MARKSRSRRTLLGRRGTRRSTPLTAPEPPTSDAEEAAPPEEPAVDPGESSEPDESPDPSEDAGPGAPGTPGFHGPLPHWPSPRYVARAVMLRGHHREPVPGPLFEEWEIRLFIGGMVLAAGFALLGLGGLIGFWIVLGDQVFAVWPGSG